MEKLNDLRELLKHEIQDVYSAEEQILEALPKMIEHSTNTRLKKALQNHLKITRSQKARLDKIQKLLKVEMDERGNGKKSGILGLFGGGGEKCKGMEGLIKEGEKIMNADLDPEVMDAAIIASAQKIEHYEICAYGTMKAFAKELNLTQVVKLLDDTLVEEYSSDDLLTELAVNGGLNQKAEGADAKANGRSNSGSKRTATAESRSASTPSRSSATSRSSANGKSSSRSASSAVSGSAKKSTTNKKKATASSKK